MTWLKIISGLIFIIKYFLEKAERDGYISQGEAQNALRSLESANAEIEKARKARLDQRAANDAVGSGPMPDDKFKRPDE